MNASLQDMDTSFLRHRVELDIRSSSCWLGYIPGIQADKLLRGQQTPFLYVLREGEFEEDYYVSYVRPDLSVAHQPFTVKFTDTGWYYENGSGRHLSPESRLDDMLYLVMHCKKGECTPLSVS